jgi:small-conductance mechanosensitive channel
MTRELTPASKTALVTAVAALIATGSALLLPELSPHRGGPSDWIRTLIRVEFAVTTVNFLLLAVLAWTYADIYRDLPNKYTRSLVLLSAALLCYAFTSNPLVHVLLGFTPRPNVGPFAFVPDLFVGLAIVVLLYQSET